MTEYQVSAVLDAICKKFGVTVDYLYPKIVRYCTVMSTAGVIFAIVGLLASVAILISGYKHGEKWAAEDSWRDWYDKPLALISVIIGTFGIVMTIIMLIVNTYNLVSVMASPEVTVLKYIMSLMD